MCQLHFVINQYVLRTIIGQIVVVYHDDIVLYGRSWVKYINHLGQFFGVPCDKNSM